MRDRQKLILGQSITSLTTSAANRHISRTRQVREPAITKSHAVIRSITESILARQHSYGGQRTFSMVEFGIRKVVKAHPCLGLGTATAAARHHPKAATNPNPGHSSCLPAMLTLILFQAAVCNGMRE